MIRINLKQVRELLGIFGGEDHEMVLTEATEGHSGPGLYAYAADHPEEGAVHLADGEHVTA